MSLPRYESYRESGVEWLGEVPAHWEVRPLKALFDIVGGSTPKSDNEEYWDGGLVWITPGDLSGLAGFEIKTSQRTISEAGLASCSSSLVPAGSVILSTRAPIGNIGIVQVEACTNQGCKALVPHGAYNAHLLAYVLQSAVNELNIRGRGTTFLELSSDELGAFRIPVPTQTEQRAIAAFLDRETAKIDALVEAQRRLIELLKEKRQAVISHAVTKGLDPTAPMKDSGVAWLGEVPAHWNVIPLKRIALLSSGRGITSEETEESGLYPVFGGNGFRGYTNQFTHDGDFVLVGRQGALCGNINYAHGKFWASEHALVALPVTSISYKWLGALLTTMQLNQYSIAAAQPGLSAEALGRLRCPFPAVSEQLKIAKAVDVMEDECAPIIVEAQSAITLLQERRSALISAAVTGKIDVRGLVKAETAETAEAA